MPTLNPPNAENLNDPAFVVAQALTWSHKLFRLWHSDELQARDPEAAARLALAINGGTAQIEARLDLTGAAVTFLAHLDGGETLELFAVIPAPRLPAQ